MHKLVLGQEVKPQDFRNFPIVVSLQFHSLSMPFQHMHINMRNLGIGVGTEVSHNGFHNWVQKFDIIWYGNKAMGNGLMLSTQVAWRPYLINDSFGEIKAGAGYLFSFRPTKSFVQKEGEWLSVGKQGKQMWTFPVGISLGYHSYSPEIFQSPFVGYQFMLVKGYSQTLPVVPQSLIQIGTRIHPKYVSPF